MAWICSKALEARSARDVGVRRVVGIAGATGGLVLAVAARAAASSLRSVVVRLRMWSRLGVGHRPWRRWRRKSWPPAAASSRLRRRQRPRSRRLAVLRGELGQVEDLHDGDDCAGVEDGVAHGSALLD